MACAAVLFGAVLLAALVIPWVWRVHFRQTVARTVHAPSWPVLPASTKINKTKQNDRAAYTKSVARRRKAQAQHAPRACKPCPASGRPTP